jgi:ferredoxin
MSRARRSLRRDRPDQPGEPRPRELRVNPVACHAHGMCIELLPERITADPWGYPIVAPGPVDAELLPLAQRAVNSCPTLALLLISPEQPSPAQTAP